MGRGSKLKVGIKGRLRGRMVKGVAAHHSSGTAGMMERQRGPPACADPSCCCDACEACAPSASRTW